MFLKTYTFAYLRRLHNLICVVDILVYCMVCDSGDSNFFICSVVCHCWLLLATRLVKLLMHRLLYRDIREPWPDL